MSPSQKNQTDLQEIRKYTLDEITDLSKDEEIKPEELYNPGLTKEVIEEMKVYYAEGGTGKCFTCPEYTGDDPNMMGL